jgi:hypothetical protein
MSLAARVSDMYTYPMLGNSARIFDMAEHGGLIVSAPTVMMGVEC